MVSICRLLVFTFTFHASLYLNVTIVHMKRNATFRSHSRADQGSAQDLWLFITHVFWQRGLSGPFSGPTIIPHFLFALFHNKHYLCIVIQIEISKCCVIILTKSKHVVCKITWRFNNISSIFRNKWQFLSSSKFGIWDIGLRSGWEHLLHA